MDNPANKNLVDAILELRAEAEQQLKRNKYYVAVTKLDELLELIRSLESGTSAEQQSEGASASNPIEKSTFGGAGSGLGRDELGDEPDAQMLADDEDPLGASRYSEDAA